MNLAGLALVTLAPGVFGVAQVGLLWSARHPDDGEARGARETAKRLVPPFSVARALGRGPGRGWAVTWLVAVVLYAAGWGLLLASGSG